MADTVQKLPVKTEEKKNAAVSGFSEWHPFDALRREFDRAFDLFDRDFWPGAFSRSLFAPRRLTAAAAALLPAIDVTEGEKGYELTAELPGLTEKDIEVKVANGTLTIRGEKKDEREEKNKDYHVSERRYGSFQRSFTVPAGIDSAKIEAQFKNGVLTVSLPKTVEAQKEEQKIAVKAA